MYEVCILLRRDNSNEYYDEEKVDHDCLYNPEKIQQNRFNLNIHHQPTFSLELGC